MSRLKLLPTIVVKYVLRTFYGLFCLFCKVDPYKVTFASYRSNELRDNLAFINQRISDTYPNYKRQFVFKKFDSSVGENFVYFSYGSGVLPFGHIAIFYH